MQPGADEFGIIQSALQSVSGLVATIVILAIVIGLSAVVIWVMVSRAGKPQGDITDGLVGEIGTALTAITRTSGRVSVKGENLRALSAHDLKEGLEIRVVAVEGMIAKVIPATDPWPPPDPAEPTTFGAPPDFDAVEESSAEEG